MECLVTKLKGSVSDTSLKKLGELRILDIKKKESSSSNNINITADEPVKLALSNGYFTDSTGAENYGSEAEYSDVGTLKKYYYSDDTDLSIVSKYSLISVEVQAISGIIDGGLKEFSYCQSLKGINIPNMIGTQGDIEDLSSLISLQTIILPPTAKGNLSSLENFKNLVQFVLYNSELTGDISVFKELSKIASISISNTKVSGDISSLANLASLTSFAGSGTAVSGSINSLKCPLERLSITPNMTGSIEEFVKSQRSAGRTTGSLQCTSTGWNNITFNGATPEDTTITWTSTQITCGETTITA